MEGKKYYTSKELGRGYLVEIVSADGYMMIVRYEDGTTQNVPHGIVRFWREA